MGVTTDAACARAGTELAGVRVPNVVVSHCEGGNRSLKREGEREKRKGRGRGVGFRVADCFVGRERVTVP